MVDYRMYINLAKKSVAEWNSLPCVRYCNQYRYTFVAVGTLKWTWLTFLGTDFPRKEVIEPTKQPNILMMPNRSYDYNLKRVTLSIWAWKCDTTMLHFPETACDINNVDDNIAWPFRFLTHKFVSGDPNRLDSFFSIISSLTIERVTCNYLPHDTSSSPTIDNSMR